MARFIVSPPSDDPTGVRITYYVLDTERDNAVCAVSADPERAHALAEEGERLGDDAYPR